jgi:hypothetical protein
MLMRRESAGQVAEECISWAAQPEWVKLVFLFGVFMAQYSEIDAQKFG